MESENELLPGQRRVLIEKTNYKPIYVDRSWFQVTIIRQNMIKGDTDVRDIHTPTERFSSTVCRPSLPTVT